MTNAIVPLMHINGPIRNGNGNNNAYEMAYDQLKFHHKTSKKRKAYATNNLQERSGFQMMQHPQTVAQYSSERQNIDWQNNTVNFNEKIPLMAGSLQGPLNAKNFMSTLTQSRDGVVPLI